MDTIYIFISTFKSMNMYIVSMFTQGDCYKFAILLKKIYGGKIVVNKSFNHARVLIKGVVYDITGIAKSDKCIFPNEEDIKKTENWSFQKQMLISVGECQYCEEPIIFEK